MLHLPDCQDNRPLNRRKPPKIYHHSDSFSSSGGFEKDPALQAVPRKKALQQLRSNSASSGGASPEKKDFSFSDIPAAVKTLLKKDSIDRPTQVQKLCYWPVKEGKDLLVNSETGTGKTLAFCLPMADKLEKSRGRRSREAAPFTLILCPSRELAQQVAGVLNKYLKPFRKKTGVLVGGESFHRQAGFIRFGVDIVVGTPGRVADFLRKNELSLSSVDQLILDEVDQMLESGFEKELHYIHERLRRKVQTLFFSATVNKKTVRLAGKILEEPVRIDAGGDGASKVSDRIIHKVIQVPGKARFRELRHALNRFRPERALIFCETRAGCENLANKLLEAGHRVSMVHGELSQQQRQIALSLLKQGQIQLLIATNVAARGLDIKGLPLVINYTLPRSQRDYTHRTGRTARAGSSGEVWNLVQDGEEKWFREICNRVGIKLKKTEVLRGAPEKDPPSAAPTGKMKTSLSSDI